ncbi:unnamed protein product [Strongylus vulgaris]|uniref:Core-binding (CB) domain-containing protein n=1 Tax=Strongylus vulgaris TaxID=40348 RepID=A0A3P7IK78_STRVU|nr:unnamed protein product [Strongylus vulgaris]
MLACMGSVSNIIDSCIDESMAPGTIATYRRVKETFLNFNLSFHVPTSALPKIRNDFIAHLIDKEKTRSLGHYIAALSHFFGPTSREDLEIQRALVRVATGGDPGYGTVRKRPQRT